MRNLGAEALVLRQIFGFFVCPERREEIGNIELKVRFSGEMSKEFPIAWFTIGPVPVEISARPFVSADLWRILGYSGTASKIGERCSKP